MRKVHRECQTNDSPTDHNCKISLCTSGFVDDVTSARSLVRCGGVNWPTRAGCLPKVTRHGQHGFGRQYIPRRSTRLAASSDSDWRALSTNAHGPSHHPADRLLPSISAHYSVATRRTRFNPFAAHVPPDFADSLYIIFNRPVSSSRIGAKYWDQRAKKVKVAHTRLPSVWSRS